MIQASYFVYRSVLVLSPVALIPKASGGLYLLNLVNLTFQAVEQGQHVFRVLVAVLHLGFSKSLRSRRK